jgi:hypothetical protein
MAKFRRGDPGKRVDAHLPTSAWKAFRDAAERRGLTIGAAAQEALAQWSASNGD